MGGEQGWAGRVTVGVLRVSRFGACSGFARVPVKLCACLGFARVPALLVFRFCARLGFVRIPVWRVSRFGVCPSSARVPVTGFARVPVLRLRLLIVPAPLAPPRSPGAACASS